MPIVELEELPDASSVWIFAAPAGVHPEQASRIREAVPAFLDNWTAHGSPVPSSWKMVDDRFVLIAADERQSPSGCSIDALYRFMRDLGNDLGVDFLDSHQIYYSEEGTVRAVSRDQFRSLAEEGEVDGNTEVIDPSVDTLGAWRSGFRRPASESWHSRML